MNRKNVGGIGKYSLFKRFAIFFNDNVPSPATLYTPSTSVKADSIKYSTKSSTQIITNGESLPAMPLMIFLLNIFVIGFWKFGPNTVPGRNTTCFNSGYSLRYLAIISSTWRLCDE